MTYEFSRVTPNLVVADVARSVAFYRDVLGFELVMTVPDAAPFVFAIVKRGEIEVYLNAMDAAAAEYPAFKDQPIGGTLTLFMAVKPIQALYDELKNKVNVVMPLEKKWYGVTEFAFTDPDGFIITFAESA
jgi:catechol 2,3-dioxygenase-like lactoylglutathione lyase family enzyme